MYDDKGVQYLDCINNVCHGMYDKMEQLKTAILLLIFGLITSGQFISPMSTHLCFPDSWTLSQASG